MLHLFKELVHRSGITLRPLIGSVNNKRVSYCSVELRSDDWPGHCWIFHSFTLRHFWVSFIVFVGLNDGISLYMWILPATSVCHIVSNQQCPSALRSHACPCITLPALCYRWCMLWIMRHSSPFLYFLQVNLTWSCLKNAAWQLLWLVIYYYLFLNLQKDLHFLMNLCICSFGIFFLCYAGICHGSLLESIPLYRIFLYNW